MAGGKRPTTMDGLVSPEPWMARGDLFPALLKKADLKPSLATTTAKASERVIADPLGKEDASQPRGRFDCLVSWGWGW